MRNRSIAHAHLNHQPVNIWIPSLCMLPLSVANGPEDKALA
jgi:hypothetical protein